MVTSRSHPRINLDTLRSPSFLERVRQLSRRSKTQGRRLKGHERNRVATENDEECTSERRYVRYVVDSRDVAQVDCQGRQCSLLVEVLCCQSFAVPVIAMRVNTVNGTSTQDRHEAQPPNATHHGARKEKLCNQKKRR